MLSNDKYKKAWNERVSPTTAHIDLQSFIDGKENHLYNIYEEYVLNQLLFDRNDIVIDYGCGGGWLGRYLLNNANFKKYIGLDISDRSITFATNNLLPDKRVKIDKIEPDKYSFKKYKPSIIVSLSVIQHMPDIETVNYFFKKVNESGAKFLILQTRSGIDNWFSPTPYKTTHDINIANRLKDEFVIDSLPGYESKDIFKNKDYTYFRFRVKE